MAWHQASKLIFFFIFLYKMFWLLIFIIGISIGLITALIPGLHSNTIISIASQTGMPFIEYFIITIFAGHMVASYIPAIFFGIPEQNDVVSIMPGQRLAAKGQGMQALKIVLISSLVAVIISTAAFYPSLKIYPVVYENIKSFIPYILAIFSLVLLIRSKNFFLSGFIFILSGLIGYLAMNMELVDPFLPLFSGAFAINAILDYKNSSTVEQKEEDIKFDFLPNILLGVFLGFVADLFPGISSAAQVATFAGIFLYFNNVRYLATIASINVSEAVFSLSTAASINKSRMGATELLSKQIKIGENIDFVLILFLASFAVCALILYLLRRRIAGIARIDFGKIKYLLIAYLISIVFVIDGIIGIGVLAISFCLGFAINRLNVEKTMAMGAIIIPTLLLLLKIFII